MRHGADQLELEPDRDQLPPHAEILRPNLVADLVFLDQVLQFFRPVATLVAAFVTAPVRRRKPVELGRYRVVGYRRCVQQPGDSLASGLRARSLEALDLLDLAVQCSGSTGEILGRARRLRRDGVQRRFIPGGCFGKRLVIVGIQGALDLPRQST